MASVHIHSIMFNEEYILPFFLDYYSSFADKIFIHDDHSTDSTAEIAKSYPKVTLIPYAHNGLVESEFSQTLEDSYKKYSRGKADWVMCVDADEFIDKDLPDVRGVVLRTKGYTMIGATGKLADCNPIRTRSYDKPVVFDPELDVKFGDGRHTVNLPLTDSKLKLLHYKYLSRDSYLKRAEESYPRIMDEEMMAYRINKGLNWYDRHV